MHSVARRISALESLLKAVARQEDKITAAIKEDLGRCAFETYLLEISMVKEELKRAIKCTKMWSAPRPVGIPIVLQPGRAFIEPTPKGLVLIIAPWNYPFQLGLVPLISAIAAGNCAILKPSELAPASSRLIKEIVESSLDPSCYQVIEGDAVTAQELLDHSFDHIFYTGSTAIGREVMKKAAVHLTPVTLELGGKSPVIVDETAPLDLAAKENCAGKFINAGQTCIAPDYVLVHTSVYDAFVSALKKNLTAMLGEDGQESSSYGRIINDRHLKRLVGYLKDGTIISGGAYNATTKFFEPTLMTNVHKNAPLFNEEIFGPILIIEPVDTIEDAIAFITARPHPLALYVFSKNKGQIDHIKENTQSGGMCINDCVIHVGVAGLPFGGVGHSGMGGYHGQFGFETFSHMRGVLQKSLKFDNPVKYAPYSQGKLRFAKAVMG